MSATLQTLLDWIAIPSVTGDEGDYGDAVARALNAAGFATERQDVGDGRFNLLARAGEPDVVFCTHLDTVPPFFGPTVDRSFVHGRGACDAKGVLYAQMLAAERLVAEGKDRVGFLLTVGEEVDGIGARTADATPPPWTPRYTIVGEPTENRFIRGHKGIFKATLRAHGVAGHSSQPGGPSAVHQLVHCCHSMLESGWGAHALFGEGTMNLGLIGGGVAPNVIAAQAEASVLVRAVEEPGEVEARLRACLVDGVDVELGAAYGPQEFLVPEDGEDGGVVAFGTDAPFLSRFGTRLLCGPGRILDAHTDHERLEKAAIDRAVENYVKTATELMMG